MAEGYPADSTGAFSENDEGNEVTDSPVGLVSANQPAPPANTAPAYTKQERIPTGGSSSAMVSGQHSVTSQEEKKPKVLCILVTAIGEAPHTENLIQRLKVLLDPPRPLGGDIKTLASAFGYTSNDINYLTTKQYGSPTEELLRSEGHNTIDFLLEKLVYIKRDDAATKLRDYIRMQECKCEGCTKSLC